MADRLKLFSRILLGLFFLSISALALFAPVLQSIFSYPFGEGIYSFLSPACHQFPTRSLWILDRPFALCSRCFGGYLGLVLGLLFFRNSFSYAKRIAFGVILILPGILDGGIQLTSNYESTWLFRKYRTPVPVFVGHPDRPCSGRGILRWGVRETYPVFEFSHTISF